MVAAKCSGGACQVAWELACRSKGYGGLAIKDLTILNKSRKMKHVHQFFHGEQNPWTDWIRYRYDGGHAADDTPCWRDIKKLIPEYRQITEVGSAMARPPPSGTTPGLRLTCYRMHCLPCSPIAWTQMSQWSRLWQLAGSRH